MVGQQQAVHGCIGAGALALADDLVDVVEVHAGMPPGAAYQAVGQALVQHHGADQHQAAAHFDLGHRHGDAFALSHAVIGLPKIDIALVAFDVDHIVMLAFLQAQAKAVNAFGNHRGPPHQNRACQVLVHHNLYRAQDPLLFAF